MEWDGIRWVEPSATEAGISWDVSTNAMDFKLDLLPQPYRMIDNLIQGILRDAVTTVEAQDSYTSNNKGSTPNCYPLNACLGNGLGTISVQTSSPDGAFILLGTTTGCVYVLQTNMGYAPGALKSVFKLPTGDKTVPVTGLHMQPLEVQV